MMIVNNLIIDKQISLIFHGRLALLCDLLRELYLFFLYPLLYISPALLPLVLPPILPVFLLGSPFSCRNSGNILSSLCHCDLSVNTACGRLLLRDILLAFLLVFCSSGFHILEHLRLHQSDQILLETVAILSFHLFMCTYAFVNLTTVDSFLLGLAALTTISNSCFLSALTSFSYLACSLLLVCLCLFCSSYTKS